MLYSVKKPGFSQRSVSKHLSISLGSINNIIKNQKLLINLEESEIKNVKRKRALTISQNFDHLLYQWIQIKRRRNFVFSNNNIKTMVLKLAHKFNIYNFVASSGYVNSFNTRHNLVTKSIHGKSGLVNLEKIDGFKETISNKLNEYSPNNIYNCDKTGLFWRQTNKKQLC